MPADVPPSTLSRLSGLIATALVVGVLYLARDVLIPIALALLLSFVLGPLVTRLERFHLGRVPSVLLATFLACVISLGLCAVVVKQLVGLTQSLPQYRQNIDEKLATFRGSTGLLGRTQRGMRELGKELNAPMTPQTKPSAATGAATMAPATGAAASPAVAAARTLAEAQEHVPATGPAKTESDSTAPAVAAVVATTRPETAPATSPSVGASSRVVVASTTQPVPVDIVTPPMSPMAFLGNAVRPVLGFLASAGVVVVFTIFVLFQREDLRHRFIRLIGREHGVEAGHALDEASERVTRYLLSQLLINSSYGVVVGLALYGAGLPDAVFWGLLSGALRFVPYLGIAIAAIGAALVSLAVFPGWTMVLIVAAVYIGLELIVANFVEPWFYGRQTGITPFAVLVAAVFWTWLWGSVGLLLSTPITVCLVVMGTFVPELKFLVVLFGAEPEAKPRRWRRRRGQKEAKHAG